MLKATDKELSTVKVCLGQMSQRFTVLVLSVSTGDVPRHVAQAGGLGCQADGECLPLLWEEYYTALKEPKAWLGLA